MATPQAAIDLGSNSALLLIVDADGRTLHDQVEVVGLGKGLGDKGEFAADRMLRASAVLESYVEIAGKYGIKPQHIRAVTTSAARRASNARSYFDAIEQKTGLKVEIISGIQEAALTWIGAGIGLNLPSGPIGVVDIGGGSTELVVGQRSRPPKWSTRVSLEVGSVRLTEEFFHARDDEGRWQMSSLEKAEHHIKELTEGVQWTESPAVLVAVAGTATTLAAMELGLTTWDREKVHGSRLTADILHGWFMRLANATRIERQRMAQVSPLRSEYLPLGAALLQAVLRAAKTPCVIISDGGLRHGLVQPDQSVGSAYPK